MQTRILVSLSFAHLVNDFLNGVVGAILPLLVIRYHLSYVEAGVITLVANVSSALVQPVFGYLSDRKGSAWVLPLGALLLGIGLWWLPYAHTLLWLLPGVIVSGMGSAAFHPDASRAVYFAAGNKRGLAQSIFQIGGNTGIALSPLSLLWLGHSGLSGTVYFLIPACASALVLTTLVRWFRGALTDGQSRRQADAHTRTAASGRTGLSVLVFVVTIRSLLISAITVFVPLLVMHRYHLTATQVWTYSFVFLLAGAAGTLAGGPVADRIGQRTTVRLSVTAAVPFALLLPYVSLSMLPYDLAALGFCLLSTFAVTVVYGQELRPGNIAMVSGLLIGFAGGIGGLAVVLMGYLADHHGIEAVLEGTVWLTPLAAIGAYYLPKDRNRRRAGSVTLPKEAAAPAIDA